jgi:hypothetical protein
VRNLLKILTISILFFLFNFNKKEDFVRYEMPNFSGIDDAVLKYYNKFLAINDFKNLEKLTIGFLPLGNKYNGFCFTFKDGFKEVILDSEYWKISFELEKEMLIAHELGHCLCNRDHTSEEDIKWYNEIFYRAISEKINGFLYDGCPDSLMHYSDFSENCYLKHYIYYWNEMQDNCKIDN